MIDQVYRSVSEPGHGPAGKDTGSHPNQPVLGHTNIGEGSGFGFRRPESSPNFAINLPCDLQEMLSPALIPFLFISLLLDGHNTYLVHLSGIMTLS